MNRIGEPADYRRHYPGDFDEGKHEDLWDDQDEPEAHSPAIPILEDHREIRIDGVVAVPKRRVLVAKERLIGQDPRPPSQVELLKAHQVLVRLPREDDDEPLNEGRNPCDAPQNTIPADRADEKNVRYRQNEAEAYGKPVAFGRLRSDRESRLMPVHLSPP